MVLALNNSDKIKCLVFHQLCSTFTRLCFFTSVWFAPFPLRLIGRTLALIFHSKFTLKFSRCHLITAFYIFTFCTSSHAPLQSKLTERTLVSGQLYLQPPSQSPILINWPLQALFFHIFLLSSQLQFFFFFFAPRGCPLTRTSTVLRILATTDRKSEKLCWHTKLVRYSES